MPEVHTRDEAVAMVDRALQRWVQEFAGVLAQAVAVSQGASASAEQVVSRCATRVSALEAALATSDQSSQRRLQAQLIHARDKYNRARLAGIRIADVLTGVAQLARSHEREGIFQAAAARGQLAAISRALEGYRGRSVAAASRGSTARRVPLHRASPPGTRELAAVDVQSANLADNPIWGEFGRGGASRADYRWAVQTWNDTVGPGVDKGMTREDFAARDQRDAAPPLRRTVDVYDMFLGTDRIRIDRRSDGSLNIVNGRHRLQIAKDLGIKLLPGEIS